MVRFDQAFTIVIKSFSTLATEQKVEIGCRCSLFESGAHELTYCLDEA
jgi:hypothetical protein